METAFLDLPESRRAKNIRSAELGADATVAKLFFDNYKTDIRGVAEETKTFLFHNRSSYDENGHRKYQEPWFPVDVGKLLKRVALDERPECCHHLERILDDRAFEHGLHHHLQTAAVRNLLPSSIEGELPAIAGSPATSVVLHDLYRVWFFAQVDSRNPQNINKVKLAKLLGFASSDGAHAGIRNLILTGLVSARRTKAGPNAETGWAYWIGPLALDFFRIAYYPVVRELTAQLLRIGDETPAQKTTFNRR